MESSMPEEIVYTDDYDFITEKEKTNDKIYEKAKKIVKSKHLWMENGEMWQNWDQSLVIGKPSRKEKFGNFCPCKEWRNLEKELENETDNQNPAVRDASEKCTVIQLRNLGCIKGWPEETKQFS